MRGSKKLRSWARGNPVRGLVDHQERPSQILIFPIMPLHLAGGINGTMWLVGQGAGNLISTSSLLSSILLHIQD